MMPSPHVCQGQNAPYTSKEQYTQHARDLVAEAWSLLDDEGHPERIVQRRVSGMLREAADCLDRKGGYCGKGKA